MQNPRVCLRAVQAMQGCCFEQARAVRTALPAGLLLNYNCARTNPAAANEVADFHFDDVAATQFTVNCQIEHGSITCPPLAIMPEADRPNLLRLQSSLASDYPPSIPRRRSLAPASYSECPVISSFANHWPKEDAPLIEDGPRAD